MITRNTAFLSSLTLAAIAGLSLFAACSDSSVAGNSAEIGNPEFASISGMLSFANGTPAARTSVRCVPQGFNVLGDTLPARWVTTTDSSGFYAIDSLPKEFAIEANNDSLGQLLLMRNLSMDDSVYSAKLALPGALRVPVDYEDGDTLQIAIPGTTYLRKVVVENGSVLVDSLPQALLSEMVVSGDTLAWDKPMQVVSDSVVSLVAAKPVEKDSVPSDSVPADTGAKEVKLEFKYPLAGLDVSSKVSEIPIALRLQGDEADFEAISKMKGAWSVRRCSKPLRLDESYFDVARKQAVFWVLLDTLKAKDSLTLTFNAMARQEPPGVFSRNFISAWHFDEGVRYAFDVANRFDGTPHNVVDTLGAVGGAFYYNGKNAYVDVEYSNEGPLNFNYSDTMSISVWTRLDSAATNTSRFVFGKGATQFHLKYFKSSEGWLFERYKTKTDTIPQDSCEAGVCKNFANSWRYWYRADSVAVEGEWAMLSITQYDSTFNLYVNGKLVADTASIGRFPEPVNTDNNFTIGRREQADSDDQYFKGVIDELFVQRIPADEDRVKVMYANQKPVGYWPKVVK